MGVVKTDIEGVYIIEPKVFGDERGYFLRVTIRRGLDRRLAVR